MKKIWCVLALLVSTASAAQLHLPGLGWKLVSDNSADINAWHKNKTEAKHVLEYADKLMVDSLAIAQIQRNGGGPAVVAHSKEINSTSDELKKIGPNPGPLSHCGAAGSYLILFWSELLSGRNQAGIARALATYKDNHEACLDQIESPPELEYEILGPNRDDAVLSNGCTTIVPQDGDKTVTWFCKARVLRAAGFIKQS